jgi:UDP-N-acetylmuramate dehydrogenase
LKGNKIGGAQISEKHANFIINLGNAKAIDVLNLIDLIKEEVKNKFDVNLELEIEVV